MICAAQEFLPPSFIQPPSKSLRPGIARPARSRGPLRRPLARKVLPPIPVAARVHLAVLIPPPHFTHLTGSTSKIFLKHAAHARFAALAAYFPHRLPCDRHRVPALQFPQRCSPSRRLRHRTPQRRPRTQCPVIPHHVFPRRRHQRRHSPHELGRRPFMV